jgi:4-hydroxy-tetrahydrodipicolinate synthase
MVAASFATDGGSARTETGESERLMFQGTYTAIVTPFTRDGNVDYERLRSLIEWQVASGVTGIVPVGSTGESATLDYDEHRRVIREAVQAAGKRVTVIAGTGANATAEAVQLTRWAIEDGADATLQVTPYYNKPNAEGLYRHFSTIADLGLPVVLYNVPSRTAREIPVDTVLRLARHPKVAALKESGGNVDRVSAIVSQCDLPILSGDDSMTLPMMAIGARGVVSVASNVAPAAVVNLVRLALDGKWEAARREHLRLFRLFTDLFVDTNPIPVKAALAMMGRLEEAYRLPLCPMDDSLKTKLRATLKEAGVL